MENKEIKENELIEIGDLTADWVEYKSLTTIGSHISAMELGSAATVMAANYLYPYEAFAFLPFDIIDIIIGILIYEGGKKAVKAISNNIELKAIEEKLNEYLILSGTDKIVIHADDGEVLYEYENPNINKLESKDKIKRIRKR